MEGWRSHTKQSSFLEMIELLFWDLDTTCFVLAKENNFDRPYQYHKIIICYVKVVNCVPTMGASSFHEWMDCHEI